MERLAKRCRAIGGWLLLCNIAMVFLSYTRRVQENYENLLWSQADYMRALLHGSLPHGNLPQEIAEAIEEANGLSPVQIIFIICLMMLPLLCSLLAGIYGIVGSSRQMTSGILSYVITVLYGIAVFQISCLWPEAVCGQRYEKGSGCFLPLLFSCTSAVLFTAGFAASSKAGTAGTVAIPDVAGMKQEQMEIPYNMAPERKAMEAGQNAVSSMPGAARGILHGLTGVYAGAEIPVADGETIHFGRLSSNELVFTNQPKVSRNHCQVRWDAAQKKFSFRDYSSNGSFANGAEECLPQNIDLWLEPGTVIAIGDDTNLFRLE